ncbi:hypothetical protein NEOLEDRAFT_1119465 [Neolentinus lepideus HHB14362 ss-1]|uniref:Uncharacterized protein n=1 Tax=Neolentinus lepideus HHB14362 ss-1 TaxID=1314782 RepID=A0A165QHE2_9AGAM|nr:hypothetical protein NEOLEDRAFT_1119465 [Neolentinus lepideus HHB14362 ss-1]
MKGDIAERDRRIQELETEHAMFARRYEDQRKLLEARSAELHVAQTFLTKADTISVTEVKNMISDLNIDIFQMSATLVDVLDLSMRRKNGGAEALQAQEEVKAWLTPDFALALGTADDPSILCTAIQGVMCSYCDALIRSLPHHFSAGRAQNNNTYRVLYRAIKECEPQAVAGRWRSLTREHLRRAGNSEEAEYESFLSEVFTAIQLLCAATGCIEFSSSIGQTAQHNIGGIIQLALHLRNVMGEKITSCDFKTLLVDPGRPFESGWMEEDGADTSENQGYLSDSRVICTTELGLLRSERISTEDGQTKDNEDVIMKPKVALQTLLQAPPIQTPPARRRRRRKSDSSSRRASSPTEGASREEWRSHTGFAGGCR